MLTYVDNTLHTRIALHETPYKRHFAKMRGTPSVHPMFTVSLQVRLIPDGRVLVLLHHQYPTIRRKEYKLTGAAIS
jgi:hypothetical protein